MAKRKFTVAQQKAAFRAFAGWIAADDERLRGFIRALKPKKKKKRKSDIQQQQGASSSAASSPQQGEKT